MMFEDSFRRSPASASNSSGPKASGAPTSSSQPSVLPSASSAATPLSSDSPARRSRSASFSTKSGVLVTNGHALTKILHAKHTGVIDAKTRFYVIWKWSYADAKVPADEAFKLAQGLGFDTESMWGRTGVLVKSGENVQAIPVEKRMKFKGLGEPEADKTPASLVDVLHRMCAFREKNDSEGMAEFLARSGHDKNASLWVVAQAVSEILPDGDKEKQLMQGLLNQREQVEEMARDKRLF